MTATAYDGARLSCNFSYFVYIVHFIKFTRGSSLPMEKSKAEESLWSEKKNEKEILDQRRKKERVPFCQEKKKKFFMTATSTGDALCWSPGFQHRSRRQTKIYHT